jgi:ABC-type lipoprotein release transport system permease subunit
MVLVLSQKGLDLTIFSQGMELFAKSGSVIFPSLSFQDIAHGFFIAQVMGFLGSVYPAWKAVRMSPIQAIYNK